MRLIREKAGFSSLTGHGFDWQHKAKTRDFFGVPDYIAVSIVRKLATFKFKILDLLVVPA